MNPDQNDTKPSGSPFTVLAGADLSLKRSFLAKLTHDAGVPEVVLPTAITDDAFFQIEEGDVDGAKIDVRPLVNGEERRVWLKGTCNPGDKLCLAAIAGSDAGVVRTVPGVAGTYRPFLIAREAGVDGQLVKVQVFIGLPEVTVE